MTTPRQDVSPVDKIVREISESHNSFMKDLLAMKPHIEKMKLMQDKKGSPELYAAVDKMLGVADKINDRFPDGINDLIKKDDVGNYSINQKDLSEYFVMLADAMQVTKEFLAHNNNVIVNNSPTAAFAADCKTYSKGITDGAEKTFLAKMDGVPSYGVQRLPKFPLFFRDIINKLPPESLNEPTSPFLVANKVASTMIDYENNRDKLISQDDFAKKIAGVSEMVDKLPFTSGTKKQYKAQIEEIRAGLKDKDYARVDAALREIDNLSQQSQDKKGGLQKKTTKLHQDMQVLAKGLSSALNAPVNQIEFGGAKFQDAINAAIEQRKALAVELNAAKKANDPARINVAQANVNAIDQEVVKQRAGLAGFLKDSQLTTNIVGALKSDNPALLQIFIKEHWNDINKDSYSGMFMQEISPTLSSDQLLKLTETLMSQHLSSAKPGQELLRVADHLSGRLYAKLAEDAGFNPVKNYKEGEGLAQPVPDQLNALHHYVYLSALANLGDGADPEAAKKKAVGNIFIKFNPTNDPAFVFNKNDPALVNFQKASASESVINQIMTDSVTNPAPEQPGVAQSTSAESDVESVASSDVDDDFSIDGESIDDFVSRLNEIGNENSLESENLDDLSMDGVSANETQVESGSEAEEVEEEEFDLGKLSQALQGTDLRMLVAELKGLSNECQQSGNTAKHSIVKDFDAMINVLQSTLDNKVDNAQVLANLNMLVNGPLTNIQSDLASKRGLTGLKERVASLVDHMLEAQAGYQSKFDAVSQDRKENLSAATNKMKAEPLLQRLQQLDGFVEQIMTSIMEARASSGLQFSPEQKAILMNLNEQNGKLADLSEELMKVYEGNEKPKPDLFTRAADFCKAFEQVTISSLNSVAKDMTSMNARAAERAGYAGIEGKAKGFAAENAPQPKANEPAAPDPETPRSRGPGSGP